MSKKRKAIDKKPAVCFFQEPKSAELSSPWGGLGGGHSINSMLCPLIIMIYF
jgi:hypothetical protein